MKKTDPRIDDTRITESSGNVFVDLGFDEAEAKVMALRVELIVHLRAAPWYMERFQHGYAAHFCGATRVAAAADVCECVTRG